MSTFLFVNFDHYSRRLPIDAYVNLLKPRMPLDQRDICKTMEWPEYDDLVEHSMFCFKKGKDDCGCPRRKPPVHYACSDRMPKDLRFFSAANRRDWQSDTETVSQFQQCQGVTLWIHVSDNLYEWTHASDEGSFGQVALQTGLGRIEWDAEKKVGRLFKSFDRRNVIGLRNAELSE